MKFPKQKRVAGLGIALLFAASVIICSTAGAVLLANSDNSAPRVAVDQPAKPPNSYPAKLENINYRGWNATQLSNGLIRLIVVPDIGGRAIQFQLGDRDLFYVNPALAGKILTEAENNPKTGNWNYGGDKVWPAPEGWQSDEEWPSIPYYALDGSRFRAEVVKNTPDEVALRVTSPEDPRTGIQFARTYHIYAGTTRVRVDQLMRNISQRQIRWGIWHLIQNDAADVNDASKPNPEVNLYVPVNPHSIYPSGYTHLYGDVRHPSDTVMDNGKMLRVHYLYRVGKIGIDSNAGWYAVVNGQKKTCFLETFKYFPAEEYPDHSSVETWTSGPGTISRGAFDQVLKDDPKETPYLLEAEVLSPLYTLDPAEERTFTVDWAVTEMPLPVLESRWAGVVAEPFSAVPSGKSIALKGTFGVYRPGSLEATFFDKVGIVLQQKKLQEVDPRKIVKLDQTVELPEGAFRVSICVRDEAEENVGFLGNVILP